MRTKSLPRRLTSKVKSGDKKLNSTSRSLNFYSLPIFVNHRQQQQFIVSNNQKDLSTLKNTLACNYRRYIDSASKKKKKVDDPKVESTGKLESTILDFEHHQRAVPYKHWRPFLPDEVLQVIDLSVKNSVNTVPKIEKIIRPNIEACDYKESYLYQIMTDPNFMETINSKRQLPAHQNPCPHCKKPFVSEELLRQHLNVQPDVNDKIFCCACGKSFGQKRYLKYHQRCHSQKDQYACGICPRKYSRLDNLTRHNVFHTNPNKFACKFCERTFARKDLLNKHVKSHENKNKYHCDYCKRYFKGPLSLENHMNIFHDYVNLADGKN